MKTGIIIPILAVVLILAPVDGFLFSIIHNIVHGVLNDVNDVANNIFNTIIPNDGLSNVDNTASRLLQTINNASPGILREAVLELNTSANPEEETYRQNVLDSLTVTANTPNNLQKLTQLLQSFLVNVPRSTLQNSGLLNIISNIVTEFQGLQVALNETEIQPMITIVEEILSKLSINLENINELTDLPRSLIALQYQLESDRERIFVVAQQLFKSNESQVSSISNLVSFVDELCNSADVILQGVQNSIVNTRLKYEDYSSSVIAKIKTMILEQLAQLPGVIEEAGKTLVKFSESIGRDMEEAVNYNDLAVTQSIAFAEQLSGTAGSVINLMVNQIKLSLSTLHKSSSPTATLIVSRLKTLLNTTDSAISSALASSPNRLISSFDRTMATVGENLANGALNSEFCANSTLNSVLEISEKTIQSLVICAASNVEDTVKFGDEILDDVDERLGQISGLSDKLDVCSEAFNSTGGSFNAYKLNSCLQSVKVATASNDVLRKLSTIQETITNKINSVNSRINSCVNTALNDASYSASALERVAGGCFRFT